MWKLETKWKVKFVEKTDLVVSAINKFQRKETTLLFNKSLWLYIGIHVTSFSQSKCIILEQITLSWARTPFCNFYDVNAVQARQDGDKEVPSEGLALKRD